MTHDEAIARLRPELKHKGLSPFDVAIAIRFRRAPRWKQYITDTLTDLKIPRDTIKELME